MLILLAGRPLTSETITKNKKEKKRKKKKRETYFVRFNIHYLTFDLLPNKEGDHLKCFDVSLLRN